MSADDTYVRTLRRAMEFVGGEKQLAEALRTSPELLGRWISGELQAPRKVYFLALDIVTQHTLARRPR